MPFNALGPTLKIGKYHSVRPALKANQEKPIPNKRRGDGQWKSAATGGITTYVKPQV
jgi:hypothetical protein